MDKVIGSGGVFIKFSINKRYYENIVNDEFFYAYIPSVTISENLDEKYDAQIKVIKSSRNHIEINYPNVILESKDMNSKDIISLIEFVLERARQKRGIICIHGSAAIVDDKAVICWGPATGMGKTSLALKLSNENLFYSDEKVLIDLYSERVVGGISRQYLSNAYWKNKFGNLDYIIHNNIAPKDKSYPITLFVYGIVCDQKILEYEKWGSSKFSWHLYEESSRKIRGTSRLFFDFSYPVQSLDTQEIALNRLNLIKKFTKKYESIYCKGNLDKMSHEIISTLSKQSL